MTATDRAARAAAPGATEVLSGWGRTAATSATIRTLPDTRYWSRSFDTAGPRGLIARGAGRSYGDAALNGGGVVVDTTHGARVHELDSGTGRVWADAGVTLGGLLERVVPQGRLPPVLPGTRHVTLGGAIAADVHGKNHPAAGAFSAHVTEFTLLTPAEGLIRVSRDERPEVFWATVGGMGLTGIIKRVGLHLAPIDTGYMLVREQAAVDLDTVCSHLCAAASQAHAVAWLDGHARGSALGRGVVTLGTPAEPGDLSPARRRDPLAYRARSSVRAPALPGRGIVRPRLVAAYNTMRYGAARGRGGRPAIRPLASFFHPLDAVDGWPGLYGRRGFVQYQFVVPFGAEDVLRMSIELLNQAGCPPSLAVLKRLGAASPAPLSFAAPGWTLALDIAVGHPALGRTLDRLDLRVTAAGGQVYLAKDSRVRPELLPWMYPRLGAWRQIRDRLDPKRRIISDLARRLGLIDGVLDGRIDGGRT